ncbi:hypothetical protein NDN08_003588 [Rhodosorus marinus]|uniref:Hint domain-containing protein n=1 Tax=Rhodosorus marinus TaxID=101924 RepID=A0AAV8V2X4_9RHOD|nr:hypothetical protein NDN08_003588 [Rhodosorus marinus]
MFGTQLILYGLVVLCSSSLVYCHEVDSACGHRFAIAGGAIREGYCAFKYAEVESARSLVQDSEGNILVIEKGTGSLVLLYPPPNSDQSVEDVKKVVLIQGLGLNHAVLIDESERAVASGGPYAFVSTEDTVYRYIYNSQEKMAESQHVIVKNIPRGGHFTRSLALDDQGRLYIATGSLGNVDPTPVRSNLKRVSQDAIEAGNNDWDTLELFASGLRNEVGLGFDSRGVLWGVENAADQLVRDDIGGDIHNDNPCEEINQFTGAGKFYGYPYCFSEGILDNGFGQGKTTQWAWPKTFPEASFTDEDCRNEELVQRPAYCLPAHWAPLGFAFQPPSGDDMEFPFPSDGEGDMIVFSHGSWNRDPPSGYAVARVKFDSSTGMPSSDDYELIHDFLETREVRPVDGIFLKDGTLLYTSDSSNELIAIRHSGTAGEQPPAPEEVCFPGSSTVELEDGSFKPMDLLDIGDRVRSSETEFTPVFLFTRRMQKDSSLYMIIRFESGESLSVASSHYLVGQSEKLILAEELSVGDALYSDKVVTGIRRERRMGVYHPHTLNDVLYVDGIRILLWPLKVAFRFGYTFKGLEGGPPQWATRLLKKVTW